MRGLFYDSLFLSYKLKHCFNLNKNEKISLRKLSVKGDFSLYFVGMRGFEPPISGPPDQHFNRTKLHPEFFLQI